MFNNDLLINILSYCETPLIIKLHNYRIIDNNILNILFKNKEYTIKYFYDLYEKLNYCKYYPISFNIYFTLKKNEIDMIENKLKGDRLILHTYACNLNSLRRIVSNFNEVELHLHGNIFNLSVLYNMLFDVNKKLSLCLHTDSIIINDVADNVIYSDIQHFYYQKKELKYLKEDLLKHSFLTNLKCTQGQNYFYFRLK